MAKAYVDKNFSWELWVRSPPNWPKMRLFLISSWGVDGSVMFSQFFDELTSASRIGMTFENLSVCFFRVFFDKNHVFG